MEDVTSARVRTADRVTSASYDDANKSMTSSISSATTRAEVWGEDSKSISSNTRRAAPPPKASQSMDLQAMAKAREKQREETIVKRHLFGVPPPDDKSLFDGTFCVICPFPYHLISILKWLQILQYASNGFESGAP